MRVKTPCEIAVWKITPSIRGEMAKMVVEDFNLNQKEAAKLLGITEAAVSQHLHKKEVK